MTARPVAVDLYAGAGGLSLGMEQAGFDVMVAAELDPVHALVHKYNFPATEVLCQDLSEHSVAVVAASVVESAKTAWVRENGKGKFPGVDAVVGGPPCQGFSVGGIRDVEDVRNGQLLRFVDLVVEIQPKVFLLENVAGILEPRFQGLRKEVIRRLTVDGGYAVSGFENIFNAAEHGVPQTRRRVLFMGSRIGESPTLEDPLSELVPVRHALEGLPNIATYGTLLRCDEVELSDDDYARLMGVESEYARRLVGVVEDPKDLSASRLYDRRTLTNSLRTVHTRTTVQRFSRTKAGHVEQVSRLFRLDPDGLARTLRAGTGTDRGSHTSPRPIHPFKNRVITVREAARLHGYPDWFRFHGTNWHGHRQVGNSVPPPLAAAAGRALLASLAIPAAQRGKSASIRGNVEWLSCGRREALAELGCSARTSSD